MRDALDLGLAVAHGVDAFAPSGGVARDAARLAVVDVAVELAQDDEVEAFHQLGLERRRGDEFGKQERRAEVGEQPQLAAQREQTEPRTLVARAALVPRTADRAEENRVRRACELEGRRRQRHARGVEPRASDRRLGEFGCVPHHRLEHPDGLRRHFSSDAVARENRNLHH